MAETYAQKNEAYWSRVADAVHKDEWVHRLQSQIQTHLTNNTDWLAVQVPKDDEGKTTGKMMDYACGNGIVSRSLHSHFSQLIGVDLADGMLAKYRETANDLGLSESQMMTIQGNLLVDDPKPTKPELSQEQLSNFDLVAICMALHHVDDIELATKKLAERLQPGGVLLIIDWAKRDTAEPAGSIDSSTAHQHAHHGHHHSGHEDQHKPHPAAHTVSHDSFTEEKILSLFRDAGCGQSSFVLADRLSDVPGARSGEMQLFFARATKL